MSQNKITFGLEQVHIAFFDESAQDQPAWKTPIPIPGAVSLTPTAEGDTNTFYADNGPYFRITNNNGYTLALVMALLPDEIKAEMFGWEIDDNGAIIEIADAQPKHFALMGQVQGDKRNRRFIYYDCQASSRPTKEKSTKAENTEPNPENLTVASSPIIIDGRRMVKGELELSETNATEYNSFFTSVYTPKFSPEGA